MNSLLRNLIRGTLYDGVVAVTRASPEQLKELIKEVNDAHFEEFHRWASQQLKASAVVSELSTGCVLSLYRGIAEQGERRNVLLTVIDELGISETKAYDSIRIFEDFGLVLVSQPQLCEQFRVESLKRLSAKSVPQAARDAALRAAKEGEQITIRRAEAIIEAYAFTDVGDEAADGMPAIEHDEVAAPAASSVARQTGSPRRAATDRPLWFFRGDTVQIELKSTAAKAHANPALILRDLRAAIEAYETDFGGSDVPNPNQQEALCLSSNQ